MGPKIHISKQHERNSVLDAISSLKRASGIPDLPRKQDEYMSTIKSSGLGQKFIEPLREVFSTSETDGAVYNIYTVDAESAELLGELLHSINPSRSVSGSKNNSYEGRELEGGGYQFSIFIQCGREPRFLAEIEKMTKRLIAPAKRHR
jgi:hypothetical protein